MKALLTAILFSLAACSKQQPPPPAQQVDGDSAVERKEVDSPPAAGLDEYLISKPSTERNLGVYFLKIKGASQDDLGCLTLEEALKSGTVRITEKAEGAEVNELNIENSGKQPVYLQAGDTVKGGQQDRTIAVDVLLPPRSGKRSIDAFCVEPGRWGARDSFPLAAMSAFTEARAPVASNEQKLAIRLDKSQDKVWEAGAKVNKGLAQSGGGPLSGATFALEELKDSYVLAAEDPAIAPKLARSLAVLEKAVTEHADAVGAAFCVNGKIQSVEIYATAGLFRKLWPKLLRSAVLEALSAESETPVGRIPDEEELRKLLSGMSGKAGKAELRPDGLVVRVFEREHAALFDTEAGGKLIHRQLITK